MNIEKNYNNKETQKKLKSENIPMTIKNVNGNINEIFRMSGFDKILKIE